MTHNQAGEADPVPRKPSSKPLSGSGSGAETILAPAFTKSQASHAMGNATRKLPRES